MILHVSENESTNMEFVIKSNVLLVVSTGSCCVSNCWIFGNNTRNVQIATTIAVFWSGFSLLFESLDLVESGSMDASVDICLLVLRA